MYLGYAHLRETLGLSALRVHRPAQVKPVTRIESRPDCLAVPSVMVPSGESVLDHVLFALKHEGVNLAILSQALPRISGLDIERGLLETPNAKYLRKAAFLWEHFTGNELKQAQSPKGQAYPLFDPEQYFTAPGKRNSRWRIDFNGLGTLNFCLTVERTEKIKRLMGQNVLERTREFINSLDAKMMDRAISWAYMHETRESFAIERESPSGSKTQRFVDLLQQAHEEMPLTEDYLTSLQRDVVSNPLDQASSFRTEQNHLHDGGRGVAGVSYIPPPPDLCRELMGELMTFANEKPELVDPLILASMTSFGFVFLHPFMDGNGRISRFLVHHSLCTSGALDKGMLLPISVAMKKNEGQYLRALRSYSQHLKQYWDVTWVDGPEYEFRFTGHESLYRYVDITAGSEFLMEMAEQALSTELKQETEFLANFDHIYEAINEQYDVRGSDLSQLIVMCLDQGGRVSNKRRKQYQHRVPEAIFDEIEAMTLAALQKSLPGDSPVND